MADAQGSDGGLRAAAPPLKLGFRPDIQGLRAIAIISVVLYHAHCPGFGGGFVGVDVFFVISGFLICGLLGRELRDTGAIALLPFWVRRMRRLLPNALLVLATVLMLTMMLVPIYRRASIAWDALAAALYVSNYRFAASAVDYFQLDAPPSPLLHFWSLSIEEQFYIVWPLLLATVCLMLPRRAYRVQLVLLGLIAAASLLGSLWLVSFDQQLAFFHGATRAWELAAGGLLAFASDRLARASNLLRMTTGWAGLALIAGCVAVFDDTMAYPGAMALLPIAGAILVIAAGKQPLGWLLGASPLLWFGSRSYSLYLWHWPALLFTGMAVSDLRISGAVGVAIAIAVSEAAYTCIEEPIHSGRALNAPLLRSLVASAAGIAVIAAASVLIAWKPALGLPPSTAAAAMADRLQHATNDVAATDAQHCLLTTNDIVQPPCIFGAPNGTHRAVLFGDSHASQWFAPLDLQAKAAGWRLDAWTKASCPSLEMPIWIRDTHNEFTACERWREGDLQRLTGADKPGLVIVSNLADYTGWLRDPASGALLSKSAGLVRWREAMAALLRHLTSAGIRVVVIRDTPQAYRDYAECLSAGGGSSCDRPRAEALIDPSPDAEVAGQFPGVTYIDLTDRICDPTTCPTQRDGQIVYRDRHHLSVAFAASLAPALGGVFGP